MKWEPLIGHRLGSPELAAEFGLPFVDSELFVRAIASCSEELLKEVERLREVETKARRARKIEEAKKLLKEEGILP